MRRFLKLLSGVELYGNELAAVRELLQNACDAVRERIARERLAAPGWFPFRALQRPTD
jgi:HSP90 family molecular chaperone